MVSDSIRVLNRLREERHRAGLSLRDVAPPCGIAVSYLSVLERGEAQDISLGMARKLAAFYGKPMDYLFPDGALEADLTDWRARYEEASRSLERAHETISQIRALVTDAETL